MKGDHPLFANLPSSTPVPSQSSTLPLSKKASVLEPTDVPRRSATMTVSEACDLLGNVIANLTPYPIQIRGEITNWKIARSGHAYFSLRDDEASLECIMWRGELGKLTFAPMDGMKIVASGQTRFYKPRGQVNFHAVGISLEGRGELEFRYRELCNRLLAEGLFAAGRKKSIPQFPMRIGLITSSVGDALFDVVTTALRRFPPLQIMFAPAQVQGVDAAADICRAIHLINDNIDTLGPIDAILLVRGGGSLEDLWAFNDETLARTIAGSRIPIATGIGHEPDQTIADLVADVAGPTPTGIAQKTVGDITEVAEKLNYCGQRMAEKTMQCFDGRNRDLDAAEEKMEGYILRRISDMHRLLDRLGQKINSIEPSRLAGQKAMAVEAIRERLTDAMQRRVDDYRPRLEQIRNTIHHASPAMYAARLSMKLEVVARDLPAILHDRIRQTSELCRHLVLRLNESHPDKILQRGFSITMLEDGSVLKSVVDVLPGCTLTTRLADGRLISVLKAMERGERV